MVKTLSGFYALGGTATSMDAETFRSEIDFAIPLAEAPMVEVIETTEDPTENCPGSASAPSAMPGFLCVYEGNDGSTILGGLSNREPGSLITRNFSSVFVIGTSSATRFGAEIRARSIDADGMVSSGTWAVTAE